MNLKLKAIIYKDLRVVYKRCLQGRTLKAKIKAYGIGDWRSAEEVAEGKGEGEITTGVNLKVERRRSKVVKLAK